MSHPIDASVKYLVTEWLADWLPLSGRRVDGAGRMAERIRREASEEAQGELWTAASVLMGMRYPRALVREVIEMAVNMNLEDNSFIQYIMDKGAVKEAQKILLKVGQVRFGPASQQVEAAVAGVVDLEQLERLTERLLLVSTWDELLATS